MTGDEDNVKVRLRFRPGDDTPAGECLWAEPVQADREGGVYRLANHAFFAPLSAGDLVEARLDREGDLQVVDLREPADSVLTVMGFDPDENDVVTAAADGWRDHGAQWSEGTGAMLCTSWPGLSTVEVLQAVTPAVAEDVVELVELLHPHERGPMAREVLDLRLDTRPRVTPGG